MEEILTKIFKCSSLILFTLLALSISAIVLKYAYIALKFKSED